MNLSGEHPPSIRKNLNPIPSTDKEKYLEGSWAKSVAY